MTSEGGEKSGSWGGGRYFGGAHRGSWVAMMGPRGGRTPEPMPTSRPPPASWPPRGTPGRPGGGVGPRSRSSSASSAARRCRTSPMVRRSRNCANWSRRPGGRRAWPSSSRNGDPDGQHNHARPGPRLPGAPPVDRPDAPARPHRAIPASPLHASTRHVGRSPWASPVQPYPQRTREEELEIRRPGGGRALRAPGARLARRQ